MATMLMIIILIAIGLIGIGLLAVVFDILGALGIAIFLPVAIVGKEFLIIIGGVILYYMWKKYLKKN